MKLNLGAGDNFIPGYISVDRKIGTEVYPLDETDFPDGTIEEIRASHVLEHFPHRQIAAILAHWVAKLKPGGLLKVAVPDFERIARQYLDGRQINVEGFLMGGQVDENDFHKAVFDEESLTDALLSVGLTDIRRWDAETADCSALEISLNLCATKPVLIAPGSFNVSAVMSVPRLGFTDNFYCATHALAPLKIRLRTHSGAYWGQGLERAIEQTIVEDKSDAILTLDYDTVFTKANVATLMRLMLTHPEADAIAPLQAGRGINSPLMTVQLPDGVSPERVPRSFFAADLVKAKTAHFGLTLIRVSALADLPKPWLWAKPAADGTWGEGRTDDDIYFWREWEKAGKSLYLATRVVVGHLELMVRWPARDFSVIHQRAPDFFKDGAPKGVWS